MSQFELDSEDETPDFRNEESDNEEIMTAEKEVKEILSKSQAGALSKSTPKKIVVIMILKLMNLMEREERNIKINFIKGF